MEGPYTVDHFAMVESQHFVKIIEWLGERIEGFDNITDTSPVAFYDLKQQADQLFAHQHLPFELSLSGLSSCMLEEDEGEDDENEDDNMVILNQSSLKGIANMFTHVEHVVVNVNNDFSIPEYNYGWMLGISMDLDGFVQMQQF